mmetsp:Transcript_19251/g.18500  ORF Transcript_19251/g.18500 Transcript_19251/m.18500 type:complete len:583 (-) Transcript_19251:612-2360(-)
MGDASTMMESTFVPDQDNTITVTKITPPNAEKSPSILNKPKKKDNLLERVFCSCGNARKKRELRWQMEQEEAIPNYGRRPSNASSLNYFDAIDHICRKESPSLNGSLRFFDTDEYEQVEERGYDSKRTLSSKSVRFFGVNLKASVSHAPSMLIADDTVSVGSLDGFPGMLSSRQVDSVVALQKELKLKEPTYQQMIQAFSGVESEPFALCRFCRARDFDVSEVLEMMSQHVDHWKEANKHDFYEDIENAVGAPLSVILTQYPCIYMGNSKQGFPVCYFNAAAISSEGLECITTTDNFVKIPWFSMMHQAQQCYHEAQAKYPEFYRLEQITIINIKGISRSFFSSKNMDVMKIMNTVLEVFPEMLHRCIVINAPSFFSWAWTLIKRILDKNTAKKIVVFSSEDKARKYLLKLIDESELASDFGGSFTSTDQAILKQGKNRSNIARQFCQLFHYSHILKDKSKEISHQFELTKQEKLVITIYTRCRQPIVFTLTDNSSNKIIKSIPIETLDLDQLEHHEHNGNHRSPRRKSKRRSSSIKEDTPFSKQIVADFDTPGTFTLSGVLTPDHKSNDEHILVVGDIFST